jgi:hypothetical protein
MPAIHSFLPSSVVKPLNNSIPVDTEVSPTNQNKYEQAIGTIRDLVHNKHAMVFIGFSGLGYEHADKAKDAMKQELQKAIDLYGKDRVAVFAGATSDGIGMVYDTAKELGLSTAGIISAIALEPENAPYCAPSSNCDTTIYLPYNPEKGKEWEVIGTAEAGDFSGKSMTLAPVELAGAEGLGGSVVVIGGGAVGKEEIREAYHSGMQTYAYTDPKDFGPNKAKADKKNLPEDQRNPVHDFLTHIGYYEKKTQAAE